MCVYYLLSRIKNPLPQRLFLIAASFVFYAWFEWKYIFLIGGSIAVNAAVSKLSLRCKKKESAKALLVFAVLFNVCLLGYFKYFDFFLDTVNKLFSSGFSLRGILLPLGISFFTFQQISFQLYVYKHKNIKVKLLDYILFVSFFAQLVAGPIVRFDEFSPQLCDRDRRYFNSESFSMGIYFFCTGLFKKLVIADSLSVFADNGFSRSSSLGLLAAWFTMLSYAFQIYFDFSGYSEMAIGLGKMFNFDLPINFDTPYRAVSVTEFWKRWHITLGKTLSEIIYFPLGGGRCSKARKCLNLFVTFLVSGIWHGAAWTFVAWGALHGAARVFEEIFKKPLEKIPKLVRCAFTFLFVSAAFTLFRAQSFSQALDIYRSLFNFSNLGSSSLNLLTADGILGMPKTAGAALLVAVTAVCLIITAVEKRPSVRAERFIPNTRYAFLCAALFAVSLLCMSRSAVFIYFNF